MSSAVRSGDLASLHTDEALEGRAAVVRRCPRTQKPKAHSLLAPINAGSQTRTRHQEEHEQVRKWDMPAEALICTKDVAQRFGVNTSISCAGSRTWRKHFCSAQEVRCRQISAQRCFLRLPDPPPSPHAPGHQRECCPAARTPQPAATCEPGKRSSGISHRSDARSCVLSFWVTFASSAPLQSYSKHGEVLKNHQRMRHKHTRWKDKHETPAGTELCRRTVGCL